MTFNDDPRVSVLQNPSDKPAQSEVPVEKKFAVSNNPVTSQIFEFEYFDILNPKYEVLTFKDVKIGQMFRCAGVYKKWLKKVGDVFAQEEMRANDYAYLCPKKEDFVLILTEK